MKKMTARLFAFALIGCCVLLLTFAGCAQSEQEAMDEGMEAAEDAMDDAEDAMDDAMEKGEEMMEDMGEEGDGDGQ